MFSLNININAPILSNNQKPGNNYLDRFVDENLLKTSSDHCITMRSFVNKHGITLLGTFIYCLMTSYYVENLCLSNSTIVQFAKPKYYIGLNPIP